MSISISVTAVATTNEQGVVFDDLIIPFNAPVEFVKYVGTKDDKTCPECAWYIGNVYRVTEVKPSLPRHPKCRCDYRDIPPAVKPVEDKKEYENWLMKQPLKTMAKIFGKEKGKLLHTGIVTLDELRIIRRNTSAKASVSYRTLKVIKGGKDG